MLILLALISFFKFFNPELAKDLTSPHKEPSPGDAIPSLSPLSSPPYDRSPSPRYLEATPPSPSPPPRIELTPPPNYLQRIELTPPPPTQSPRIELTPPPPTPPKRSAREESRGRASVKRPRGKCPDWESCSKCSVDTDCGECSNCLNKYRQ